MTKVITFAGVNLLMSGFSPVMDATLQDNSIRRRHTGYRPETANLINIYNMCGIVAIFNISGPMGQLRDKALRMSQKIRHRGPDWSGIYTGHTAILAHERLSIVDPQSGRQPLFSCDRKQILAVNGEIYNHQDLRAQYANSYTFATGSDCESILPLYRDPSGRAVHDVHAQAY